MKTNTTYYLSTDGYNFKYRPDRYDPTTIHVEMFKEGNLVHKQIAHSELHKVSFDHHQVINQLEAKISLGELDPTGLKQIVQL